MEGWRNAELPRSYLPTPPRLSIPFPPTHNFPPAPTPLHLFPPFSFQYGCSWIQGTSPSRLLWRSRSVSSSSKGRTESARSDSPCSSFSPSRSFLQILRAFSPGSSTRVTPSCASWPTSDRTRSVVHLARPLPALSSALAHLLRFAFSSALYGAQDFDIARNKAVACGAESYILAVSSDFRAEGNKREKKSEQERRES